MLRLDKLLADCGIGTRSEVKKILKLGQININGIIIKDGSTKVNPESDIIKYKGNVVNYSKYIYIMLNKPQGVISATEDDADKTVIDILPEKFKNKGLFPVGRLDKDTIGLLLLTNDGEFAHNTLSPKKHIDKTYIAEFDGYLPPDAADKFIKGIELKDFKCKPAILNIISEHKAMVIICEGKYHQVKRMFKALGCNVNMLKRTAFGDIALDSSLKEGEARELNESEMKYISKFCGK